MPTCMSLPGEFCACLKAGSQQPLSASLESISTREVLSKRDATPTPPAVLNPTGLEGLTEKVSENSGLDSPSSFPPENPVAFLDIPSLESPSAGAAGVGQAVRALGEFLAGETQPRRASRAAVGSAREPFPRARVAGGLRAAAAAAGESGTGRLRKRGLGDGARAAARAAAAAGFAGAGAAGGLRASVRSTPAAAGGTATAVGTAATSVPGGFPAHSRGGGSQDGRGCAGAAAARAKARLPPLPFDPGPAASSGLSNPSRKGVLARRLRTPVEGGSRRGEMKVSALLGVGVIAARRAAASSNILSTSCGVSRARPRKAESMPPAMGTTARGRKSRTARSSSPRLLCIE